MAILLVRFSAYFPRFTTLNRPIFSVPVINRTHAAANSAIPEKTRIFTEVRFLFRTENSRIRTIRISPTTREDLESVSHIMMQVRTNSPA